MAGLVFWSLVVICFAQFIFIANLYSKLQSKTVENLELKSYQNIETDIGSFINNHKSKENCPPVIPTHQTSINLVNSNSKVTISTEPKVYGGVAAVLLLHAPTWFQRRYTMMIQNTIANIPDDWVVQIFYTAQGQSKKGIDLNPGIQQYITSGKVVLTTIPPDVLSIKKKRYELMMEPWIWQNMLAENILVFGGNAVICSNSPYKFSDFLEFDYIGSPWDFKKGAGGDGGISLRKKSVMVNILEYELAKHPKEDRDTIYKTWGQDDQFFVSRMLEIQQYVADMNNGAASLKKSSRKQSNKIEKQIAASLKAQEALKNIQFNTTFRIATRNDTMRFSAIGGVYNHDVLTVSGTLPLVSFDDRQKFMNVCPEIKMFYPALHDPSCFGATPDGDKCALTICALKNKTERRGGC